MQKLTLGNSGVEVSALCLGTDVYGSKREPATCFALMDYFRSQGGTFIDTGNFYAAWLDGFVGGESETTIGNWLKDRGCRNEMVIATKLGFDYPGSPGGLTASEIESECDKSLKRLQTDHLDVYYSHRDDRDTPLEETMTAYTNLIKKGKVRAIGASNLTVWRIAQANMLSQLKGLAGYSVVQQRYTYVRPRYGANFGPQIFINEDLKDYARSSGVSLLAYSVLLAGSYNRDSAQLPPQYAGPDSDKRFAAIREVAAEMGATVSQVVLAWLRQSDPPVLPIIAGSSVGQLEENIKALDLKLEAGQMERLNNAGNLEVETGWIKS